jgi:PadR family transcriptional regulator, regulatory protein PadR
VLRDYLGEFEHVVMLALLRLDDRAYGVTVRQEIEVRTGREVSIGAIYATLARLETKRYVNSYLGDATPERGGKVETFFPCHCKRIGSRESYTVQFRGWLMDSLLRGGTHNDSGILAAFASCLLAD